jgi:hypothetical protein
MSSLFDETPAAPRGAAQCPTCGRFCKIIRVVSDASPLSAEEGYYVVVHCPRHGKGVS